MGRFITLTLCGVYVIWPLDLIPDLIPVIGWIDDLAAIAIGIGALMAKNK